MGSTFELPGSGPSARTGVGFFRNCLRGLRGSRASLGLEILTFG